jgi:two-component system response regulator MprA
VKVLVVDDERAVRESLDRALRLSGDEVALATDGLGALRAVVNDRPDAMVLDVAMPGPDGLAVGCCHAI